MNPKQKEKLKELVEMGKWNYVFTKGVLYFGGLMFLFFILWEKFIMGYEIDEFTIIFNFIIWGIAGLIFGLWTWSSINKKLKEK